MHPPFFHISFYFIFLYILSNLSILSFSPSSSLSLSQPHATPAHIVLPSPSPIEAPYVSHPYIPSRPSSAHRWERLNGYKITLLSLGFLQIGFFQIEVQIHHQYSSESSLNWVSFKWVTSNDVAPTLNGVIADLLIKSNYFCCLSFWLIDFFFVLVQVLTSWWKLLREKVGIIMVYWV